MTWEKLSLASGVSSHRLYIFTVDISRDINVRILYTSVWCNFEFARKIFCRNISSYYVSFSREV